MTRCLACGANLVSARCPACSPAPPQPRESRAPDRQQELGWQFFKRRGWRYAAFAVPPSVGFVIFEGVTDGLGPAVFLGLPTLGYVVYGIYDWKRERGENRRVVFASRGE